MNRFVVNRSVLTDLSKLWAITLVAVLYMGAPPLHSVLLSAAVVMQASIGTAAISRVFNQLQPTILIACGPGLIIGGALSVLTYHISGRGWFGLSVVAAAGVVAMTTIIAGNSWSIHHGSHIWQSSALLGLTALAISWEFRFFLVPGLVLLGASMFGERLLEGRRLATILVVTLVSVIAVIPLTQRGTLWWLVTDDYLFLEVLTQHLARSSPLQNFGVMNWTSYHWLSYGWSAVLNEMSGRPEILMTLTRVMPVVYSMSLGASLMAIVNTLHGRPLPTSWSLPTVSALVLFNRLDWSGTSTAGVFAVIAGAILMLILAAESEVSLGRRLFLYGSLGAVIALTKFSSLLIVIPTFFIAEYSARVNNVNAPSNRARHFISALIGVVVSVVVIAITGEILGRFIFTPLYPDFSLVNPRAPVAYSITQMGVIETLGAVLMTRLWVLLTLLIIVISYRNELTTRRSRFVAAMTTLCLLGVITDTFVFGDSNAHEYFSGPLYFLATFAILLAGTNAPNTQGSSKLTSIVLLGSTTIVFALVLERLILVATEFLSPTSAIFVEILADKRLGAAIFTMSVLIFSHGRSQLVRVLPRSLLISLLVIAAGTHFSEFIREPFPSQSSENQAEIMGPRAVIETGRWIADNVPHGEVLATNYIFVQPPESNYADWGLAAWSNREFLVLDVDGPWFDESSSRHQRARYLSEAFAESPSQEILQELESEGIRWFVVDRRLTNQITWYPFATVRYTNEHFLVLYLSD